jgi:Inner membrane protein YgaP-like, transmembrane domain
MTYINEGLLDRVIRVVVAIALAYSAWALWAGTWSVVLLVLATIALGTAIAGWSLPYALLGISTNKRAW